MESNRSSLYLFTGVVVLTFLLAIVLTVVYVNNSPGGAAPQAVAEASGDEGATPAEATGQEAEASGSEDSQQSQQMSDGGSEQAASGGDDGDGDGSDSAQDAASDGSDSGDSQSGDSESGDDGDGGSDSGDSKAESGESSGDPNVKVVDGVQVIKLTGNDQMQYNINEFKVKAGQPIRIEFEHVGNLPKAAMGHNVVVLVPGTNEAQFAQKGQEHAQQDYVPQGEEAQAKIVAHTEMVGSGGTTSIEFTVEDPGTYPYVCTFPAHFATMNGEMIVEE